MNEYIINPRIFYFIDIVPTLGFACLVFSILLAIFALISLLTDETKYMRIFIKLCITTLLLGILIPQRETMYKMLIASQVTTENIEIAKDTIKSGVDYIFEKMEALE